MIDGIHTMIVLSQVAEERHRQDETWGQQDHPVHADGHEDGVPVINGTYAEAEQELKCAFSQGYRSGAVILLEEVMEALAAKTVTARRQELVQVAAVAVMMVEALDRAEAEKHGPGCELGMWHGGDCGPSFRTEPVPATFRNEWPGNWAEIPGDALKKVIQEAGTYLADGVYSTGVFDDSGPVPPLKPVLTDQGSNDVDECGCQ
jgi:hypothetical protein